MRNVIFIISMILLFLTLLVGLESIFTGGFQGLLRKSKLLIPLFYIQFIFLTYSLKCIFSKYIVL